MSNVRHALVVGLAAVLGCESAPASSEKAAAPPSDSRADSRSAAVAEASPAPAPTSAKAGAAPPSSHAAPKFEVDRGAEPAEMDALADAPPRDEGRRRVERSRPQPAPSAGLLTAGRWSDRDDWSRWQNLLGPGSQYDTVLDLWNMGNKQRVAVTLRGRIHTPVDARLTLEDHRGQTLWTARADNNGRADLYLPPHQSGHLGVRAADGTVLASRDVNPGEEHDLRTNRDVPVASALDLMFVVDTTGSMGDELSFLQTELSDIVARVERNSAQKLTVRTSVNFYRDHGDDYVVRSYPFTADLNQSLGYLRSERADGGGDFPEALDAAVADGVRNHRWSDSAVARLMFVVTDAPPHSDGRTGQNLRDAVAQAADKGIRIVPVASSGIDKPAEFVLREMAVSTGGTYVFLTDHSGVGNGHIEPTVGPHKVEPLNDLIVDVIDEYTQVGDSLLVAPVAQANVQEQPCGYAVSRAHGFGGGHDPWWYVLVGTGLLLPLALAGYWWHRRGRAVLPSPDARVARARRLVDELTRLAKTSDNAEARSWSPQVREVAEGIEQLSRQRQAIDASLRSAGAPLHEHDADGMRGALAAEVSQRRQAIDAEIDAGLLSIESAYLHVIGGVGHRSTAQANLDAAREALHTRLEVERELRIEG
ncbi:MAG: VWA domain-containing protein [Deltaproteobacteria bacterium]|nr:VWA domain-containing protein [Deltaproteobacteria bacterium]